MTWEPDVVDGHPSVDVELDDGTRTVWTVCASCERLRTILFLTGDRWLCVSCKSEGTAAPTLVSYPKPKER